MGFWKLHPKKTVWFCFFRNDKSNVFSLSVSRDACQARPQCSVAQYITGPKKRLGLDGNNHWGRGVTTGLAPKAAIYYKVLEGAWSDSGQHQYQRGPLSRKSKQQQPSESSRCVPQGNQPFRKRSQTVTGGPGQIVQSSGKGSGKIHALLRVRFLGM